MVTALICVIGALWIPGLILLVVSARHAPVGFEDAAGFHAVEEHARHQSILGSAVHAS
jgi:hypothetical protein